MQSLSFPICSIFGTGRDITSILDSSIALLSSFSSSLRASTVTSDKISSAFLEFFKGDCLLFALIGLLIFEPEALSLLEVLFNFLLFFFLFKFFYKKNY